MPTADLQFHYEPHRIPIGPEASETNAFLCIWVCTGKCEGSGWSHMESHWTPMGPQQIQIGPEASETNAFLCIWVCTGKCEGSEWAHMELH